MYRARPPKNGPVSNNREAFANPYHLAGDVNCANTNAVKIRNVLLGCSSFYPIFPLLNSKTLACEHEHRRCGEFDLVETRVINVN